MGMSSPSDVARGIVNAREIAPAPIAASTHVGVTAESRNKAEMKGVTKAPRGDQRHLNVKPKMHDVTVLDDIVLAFDTHLAGILGALLAATGNEIVITDGLGADEAALEVGVDGACCFRRLGAPVHGPGARFLWSGGEKGDEIQQVIAGPDHAIEAGLL